MKISSIKKPRAAADRRRLQRLARSRWMPCAAAQDSEILQQIGESFEAAANSGLRHFSAMDRTVALPYNKRLGKAFEREERELPVTTEGCAQQENEMMEEGDG